MTFSLPLPPTSNNAYACVGGRKIKTALARAYANEVGYLVADQLRTSEQPTPDLRGERLAVMITVHPPDRRRRDIVSAEKLATDAIFTQLGLDDSQIDRLLIQRGHLSRNGGGITYTITTDTRTPF